MALSGVTPVTPASAQGFLDAIFGGFDRAIRRELRLPPRVHSYSDPRYDDRRYDDRRERRASGEHRNPSSGFCVRTCDGFYFSVKSVGDTSAAEFCRSFCPAAKTKVFGGSKVDYSVAGDGQRYADLDTAFLYRERKVEGCTCNGTHQFGLARLVPESDPTLRPGDIIATNDGLVIYSGGDRSRSGQFTPIAESGGSSEWRRRLMSIKVTPAPPRTEIPSPPANETAERTGGRRAQR
jgi:hypothetical protein